MTVKGGHPNISPTATPPSKQVTYDAKVTVPSWATCLMSALEKDPPKSAHEEDSKVTFSWEQPVPIPSYLIALAVGELESRDISARFGKCLYQVCLVGCIV